MRTFSKVAAAFALVVVVGCSRLSPAGFWKLYQSKLIVAQASDQGPWGGKRWIQWSSRRPGTFVESDVKSWAESHGWRYMERMDYTSNMLADWIGDSHTPVFPLLYPEHSPTHGFDNSAVDAFPRHITGDLIVLKFNSSWMRARPGSAHDETAYGYAVLSKDGCKLAIYHLWGEA